MTVSYPRLAARTLRFTLGVPRNLTLAPDGSKVWFIRTPDGVTRTGQLWQFDVATSTESLLVDPQELLGGRGEELSAQERARRERSRESAAGLVSFQINADASLACFVLSGQLFVTDLTTGQTRQLPTAGTVIDPKFAPAGELIAYATAEGELRTVTTAGEHDRAVACPDSPEQAWGRAEFIAAEEMDRFTGLWWSPDGRRLLAERFDDSAVPTWYIADPANPDRPAVAQRYPAAGSVNSDVSLWLIDPQTATRTEVVWDRAEFEYLARVDFSSTEPIVQVLNRAQNHSLVLRVDPATGATTTLRELRDEFWVELSAAPRIADGKLITVEDIDDRRRVCVDGIAISSTDHQVRSIISVTEAGVLATASSEPTEVQVVSFGFDGTVEPLTDGQAVHTAVAAGDTVVISRTELAGTNTEVTVRSASGIGAIKSVAEPAPFDPKVQFVRLGERQLRAAVLFPRDHVPGSAKLPILLDPYGGPHAQRVLASGRMFLEPQWMADQGFCVVVSDGRGTPGRGHAWERAIRDRFAEVTLADQVDTVAAITELFADDVDPSRVGITGWSYGGYLSALAVLARPDVFHAAVAGAPVTEWRLYDTCYTERYLGHPEEQSAVYDRNSLLPLAPKLQRPLMLIHGLADDNVVAAHTLRLSAELLAAGRPHTVLPLVGVTHMTPQEEVAENLKLVQMEFLRQQLA